jgi:hypothetical protein
MRTSKNIANLLLLDVADLIYLGGRPSPSPLLSPDVLPDDVSNGYVGMVLVKQEHEPQEKYLN